MTIIIAFFVFFLGAIFGSFFNVCIYRIPRKLSIINPPSYCPVCKRKIKPIHNIPIFSYLFLKGKCAYCGSKIPIRYFLVEVISGFLFLLIYYKNGNLNLILLKNLIFVSFAIMIFFIDFEHKIIPDVFTYPLMIIGILFSFFNVEDINFITSLIGGVSVFLFIFLISFFCEIVKKRACIGGGDLKYLAAIGFFVGIIHAFLIIFFASILALLVIIVSGYNLKKSFPFGPFLAVASLMDILFGKWLIHYYLKNIIDYAF